jgi:hypothetical protein
MKRIKKISGLILKILDILVENLLCRNDEVIMKPAATRRG